MAFTQVGSQKSAVTATTITYPGSVTAGHLLVCASTYFNSTSITFSGFTDSGAASGNTWHTMQGGVVHGTVDTIVIGWTIAQLTGALTVTPNWANTSSTIWISSTEFSGTSVVATLAQDGNTQSASSSSVSTISTPSITTTNADDLALWYFRGGNTITPTGWTDAGTVNSSQLTFQADVAAGTYAANGTETASYYAGAIIALGNPPQTSVAPPRVYGQMMRRAGYF